VGRNTTTLSKNSLAAQFDKAVKLHTAKRYTESIPLFETIIKKKVFKEALVDLGLGYMELGNLEKAKEYMELCRKAPHYNGKKDIDDYVALHNLGTIYYEEENDDKALEYFLMAAQKSANEFRTRWNIGTTDIRRFCDGKEVNLLRAWFYYDNRFKLFNLNVAHSDLELWDFTSKGDSIVVLRDQGRGDTLMFARYLPFLEDYFDKVYVQSDPYMETLFDYEPYRDTTKVKLAVPMCSLGKILDWIPKGDFLSSRWKPREKDGVLRVGCVWNGVSDHANDSNRSCGPEWFDKLTGIEKYTLGPNLERDGYKHLPAIHWEETIANLNTLDLVITVDTAIAHLCGCLGMPCWVLMPLAYCDYRWGTGKISGDRTIWYDSVRVVRNPNSWDKVFTEVQARINGTTKRTRQDNS